MPQKKRVTAHGKRRVNVDEELLTRALVLIAEDIVRDRHRDNR